MLPGLVRYDEAFGSEPIRHAFRFTVRATNGYVYPASHRAGNTNGAPPMGTRLRLKASRDLSGFPVPVQRIFQAMKTHGLILADNGSDMYVQGTYDTRWDNDVLNPAFASLKVGDFEVVQLGWQPTGLPTDPCETGPGPSCNEWLLPSSARIGGEGGAFYTTDLTVANTGVTEARLFVRFLGHDADGRSGADRSFLLAAGRSVTYADVLGSLFGYGEAWGAVQLRSASPSLVATSQTWTPGGGRHVRAVGAARLRDGADPQRHDADDSGGARGRLVPDEPDPREWHRSAGRRGRLARRRDRRSCSARAAGRFSLSG